MLRGRVGLKSDPFDPLMAVLGIPQVVTCSNCGCCMWSRGCLCVCVCVHIHVCCITRGTSVCVCACACACACTCIPYVCVCGYILHVCVCACMRVCVVTCLCSCVQCRLSDVLVSCHSLLPRRQVSRLHVIN